MKKIIKFYANWCSPCRAYASIFENTTSNYADQVEIHNINIDEDTSGLANKYKVMSIPSTVLVKEDGSFIKKDGMLSEHELTELILS
jgi:thiol-disulfide isomerase/thioredoxin